MLEMGRTHPLYLVDALYSHSYFIDVGIRLKQWLICFVADYRIDTTWYFHYLLVARQRQELSMCSVRVFVCIVYVIIFILPLTTTLFLVEWPAQRGGPPYAPVVGGDPRTVPG